MSEQDFLKLPKFGQGPGLNRVKWLLEKLGIKRENLSEKSIVITGSNGKGSTAKITSELIKAFGIKAGLFTSPHLFQYNERFQIDGVSISDPQLKKMMAEIMKAINKYEAGHNDKVGAFEAQFVLAVKWFEENKVDCIVLEAGIGGYLDATKMAGSFLTALVSLDFEHTDLLGKTLQEVALDKIGACADGGQVICGVSCEAVREEIEQYAGQKDIKTHFLSDKNWQLKSIENGRQLFNIELEGWGLGSLKSKLIGEHQLNNHAAAMFLAKNWLEAQGKWSEKKAAAVWPKAIEETNWPGRLERLSEEPAIYVDVGHTPEAIKVALAGFKALAGQEAILVTGGSYNKKVDEMMELLVPHFKNIICTKAYHRGMDAEKVAKYVKKINKAAKITIAEKIEDAAKIAIGEAKKTGLSVYVAGGLFLAIEFAYAIKGGQPEKLKFF